MIILPEDKNIVLLLPRRDAYALLLALFSETEDLPELTPLANMAYTVIRGKSDRISERKARAGRKGGAPENNRNAAKQTEQVSQADQAEQADARKTTFRTSTVTDTVPVPDTDTVPVTGSTSGAKAPPRAGARTHATTRERTTGKGPEKIRPSPPGAALLLLPFEWGSGKIRADCDRSFAPDGAACAELTKRGGMTA